MILVGHGGLAVGLPVEHLVLAVRARWAPWCCSTASAAPGKLARELIESLLPALKEAEDRAEVEPFTPVPDAYRELLGAYRDPEFGDDLHVEWRDGKLVTRTDDPCGPRP